jgi:hypothetical protein
MKRVVLQSTPVLRFKHDDSAIRGVEIVNFLEEVISTQKHRLRTKTSDHVESVRGRTFRNWIW